MDAQDLTEFEGSEDRYQRRLDKYRQGLEEETEDEMVSGLSDREILQFNQYYRDQKELSEEPVSIREAYQTFMEGREERESQIRKVWLEGQDLTRYENRPEAMKENLELYRKGLRAELGAETVDGLSDSELKEYSRRFAEKKLKNNEITLQEAMDGYMLRRNAQTDPTARREWVLQADLGEGPDKAADSRNAEERAAERAVELELYREALLEETGAERVLSMSDEELKAFNRYYRKTREEGIHPQGENAPLKEVFEKYEQEPIKETDLVQEAIEPKEIQEHWEAMKDRTFVTNGEKVQEGDRVVLKDEKITYQEAVERVQTLADQLMDQADAETGVKLDRDDRKELKDRFADALIRQQVYTDARGIGEHGIKHIFGNIESTEYALSESGTSGSARVEALIAQMYQDEG